MDRSPVDVHFSSLSREEKIGYVDFLNNYTYGYHLSMDSMSGAGWLRGLRRLRIPDYIGIFPQNIPHYRHFEHYVSPEGVDMVKYELDSVFGGQNSNANSVERHTFGEFWQHEQLIPYKYTYIRNVLGRNPFVDKIYDEHQKKPIFPYSKRLPLPEEVVNNLKEFVRYYLLIRIFLILN